MLTSLNGKKFCLNSELIYKIEKTADTIITLTDGKSLRVRDDVDNIIDKIVAYKRRIYIGLPDLSGGEK